MASAGAAAAGIDSLFVMGGIHAEELGVSETQLTPNRTELSRLCKEHKAIPNFVIPFLK